MSFIGIDVAKAQLEFVGQPSGEAGTVANDDRGVTELVARCQRMAPTLIVCEATRRAMKPRWSRP
jgi:transposase